jgi:hypothetical protein
MAMRLDIEFPKPLDRAGKTRVLLAVAALAKSERVRFIRGDQAAVVMGEALSGRRLAEALAEEGIPVESVRSSLDGEDEILLDDIVSDPARRERVRAIGR